MLRRLRNFQGRVMEPGSRSFEELNSMLGCGELPRRDRSGHHYLQTAPHREERLKPLRLRAAAALGARARRASARREYQGAGARTLL